MLVSQIEKYLASLKSGTPLLRPVTAQKQPPDYAPERALWEPRTTLPVAEVKCERIALRRTSPRVHVLRPSAPYEEPLLRRYGAFYEQCLKELEMGSREDVKRLTVPVPSCVYDKMNAYLAKHKNESGYPQTIREFVCLAVAHLTVDLEADAPVEENKIPA